MTEELLDLVGLKDTTTGRDITNAVINYVEAHQIDLKNLISITTDSASSMVGKNIGAVNLTTEQVKTFRKSSNEVEMFICHCFLHLKNFLQIFNLGTGIIAHCISRVIQSVSIWVDLQFATHAFGSTNNGSIIFKYTYFRLVQKNTAIVIYGIELCSAKIYFVPHMLAAT